MEFRKGGEKIIDDASFKFDVPRFDDSEIK